MIPRFNIVIFTNQGGLFDDSKIYEFVKFCESFLCNFDFELILFASIKYDFNRKPCPGLYKILTDTYSLKPSAKSFFVGDAGGRKKDFSASDL
jgi:histidinol phosphatase-like enzyme